MGTIRSIDTTLWADPKIEEFTAEDKYFWLYCLTNQHNNLCGAALLSKRTIAYEMGYSVESVANLIQRFEEKFKLIRYNNSNNELLILNWSKYNWNTSPLCKKGVERALKHVKTPDFVSIIEEKVREIFSKIKDETKQKTNRVCIGYVYPPVPVPVPVINNNISSNKFIKPSYEEVSSYCRERKNKVDANAFVDFYESKGWLVGKNPMKDWKAAVRTWEKRHGEGDDGRRDLGKELGF